VTSSGGLVPVESLFTSFPAFELLGDGRVVVPGAEDARFPGPALPAMNERRLNESGIQAVLASVAASHQLDADRDWQGAGSGFADATATVFTLRSGGQEVTVSVYALGLVDPAAPPQGMTAEELGAHRVLNILAQRLQTLDTWIPASGWADAAWHPYRPGAMRLLVRNADADPPDDSGLPNQELDWPIAADPATFGDVVPVLDPTRCGVVSGADADAWYEALSAANDLARWLHGGHRYQVTPRFLLPDEPETCPDQS
jgi:hypothetical protein